MIQLRRALPLLLIALSAGCTTQIEAPDTPQSRETYQTIANALPRGHFDWGDEPPGVVRMSASAKAEGPLPQPEQPKATERGFSLGVHVYRPRNVWIPYRAIESCSTEWRTFPNVLLVPLLLVPYQSARVTVVVDLDQVEGFRAAVMGDCDRLEQISREIGLGGPWSFAQGVRAKFADDAAIYGGNKLGIHFDYGVGWFTWWPADGRAGDVARAFAWAAANPDAPELEPKPEKEPSQTPGEGSGGDAEEKAKDAPSGEGPSGE